MMLTILNFWRAQVRRGEKPRAVHAVVSMGGGEQPTGCIIGWSVSRRAALAERDRRSNAGPWAVVRMVPQPDTLT